ncbi:MAG: hypothetical protein KGS61_08355 [Verrucomicrobia bacterium]|nr:hypothetical protein [Verrucomicrobiota bacterium]
MNQRSSIPFLAGLCAALLLDGGCASSRIENKMPSTQTQVDITHANYKMIKAGAVGRSYGFRFLLGLIPLAAPSSAAARTDLYRNVGQPVNGKSIALINTVEDRSTTWLLLFSVPKLVITGDVVEFQKEATADARPTQ